MRKGRSFLRRTFRFSTCSKVTMPECATQDLVTESSPTPSSLSSSLAPLLLLPATLPLSESSVFSSLKTDRRRRSIFGTSVKNVVPLLLTSRLVCVLPLSEDAASSDTDDVSDGALAKNRVKNCWASMVPRKCLRKKLRIRN